MERLQQGSLRALRFRVQAYVDTAVMTGQTGVYNDKTQQFDNITYLKCSPENDFFPDLEASAHADVVSERRWKQSTLYCVVIRVCWEVLCGAWALPVPVSEGYVSLYRAKCQIVSG